MKRRLAAAAALFLAGRALAENPGITSAPILQIPMGSRALGMGGAFTAVANDASALYYNPAGLARLNAHEVSFSFASGLADNTLQHMAYGGPVPWTGISGNGYSSVGGSLLYSQSGNIEVNRTNPDGSFNSTSNLNAGSDLVLSAGYAERVGSTPVEFKDQSYGISHFVGISGKFVRSTLVQQYSASAFTVDAGYLVNSPETGISFGLSALNIVGSMKYISQGDPLPATIRSGFAYQVGVPSIHSLTLAADSEYLFYERQWHVDAGLEYFWLKSYGLRIGYQFMRDQLGLTAGFGVRWRSRILIDYAWAMANDLHDTHRFTISYRFGGVAPALRGRERRPFIQTAPDRAPIPGLNEQAPQLEPAPRPRAIPREERPGVPGWIY